MTTLARAPFQELPAAAGLLTKLRLTWLLTRFPERLVWAAFVFVNGFVTIALLAALAMRSGRPSRRHRGRPPVACSVAPPDPKHGQGDPHDRSDP